MNLQNEETEAAEMRSVLCLICCICAVLIISAGCTDADSPAPNNVYEEPHSADPNTYLPQFKINGMTYYLEGSRNTVAEIAESEYLGRIETTVPLSQRPAENGQANFDAGGAPYA